MKLKKETKIAKDFLSGFDLNYILDTIQQINFNYLEKRIVDYMLEGKTTKEISLELNLSLSYISTKKQIIYKKINGYLALKKNNYLY